MRHKRLLIWSVAIFIVAAFLNQSAYADYGNSSPFIPGPPGPPVCTAQTPDTPVLYQPWHPALSKATNAGEVKLHWTVANRADHYVIGFGLSSGNYIYGAQNVGSGNSSEYTVTSLAPGQKYYFAVMAVNGCAPSSFSNEWSGVAKGGAVYSYSAPKANNLQSYNLNQTNTLSEYVGGSAFVPANELASKDNGVSLY